LEISNQEDEKTDTENIIQHNTVLYFIIIIIVRVSEEYIFLGYNKLVVII
jgi:hypothetical protein